MSLNASPYEINKIKKRELLAIEFSKNIDAPVIYVNQTGGQDELVFDGNSFAVNQERVITRLRHCKEELRVIEISSSNEIIFDSVKS